MTNIVTRPVGSEVTTSTTLNQKRAVLLTNPAIQKQKLTKREAKIAAEEFRLNATQRKLKEQQDKAKKVLATANEKAEIKKRKREEKEHEDAQKVLFCLHT